MSGFAKIYLLIAVVALSGCSEEKTEVEEPVITADKPNILVLISDDLGLDASNQHLAPITSAAKTPTIDSLAQQGVTFTNVWATPACATTRASILTGQHGIRSGIRTVPGLLEADDQFIVDSLIDDSESSYQVGFFGKWHLAGGAAEDSHPNDMGIPYFAGNVAGNVDDYYNWLLTVNGNSQYSTNYHTSEITDQAIKWQQQLDDTKPWFMWLAYSAPHGPFHEPPQQLHSRSLQGLNVADDPREFYLAAIEAMDTEIGRLLNSLSEKTLNNTVIIYISDNGSPKKVMDISVLAKSQSKGTLYEGGIKVPMIISGAQINKQGYESTMVNSVDLYNTILTLAGKEASSTSDGYSLFYLLNNSKTGESREFNYSEFVDGQTQGYAVRNSTYKFIEQFDGSHEMFNLVDDAYEKVNLLNGNLTDSESAAYDLLKEKLAEYKNY